MSAIDAFASHLLAALPSNFTDDSQLIETADGAELVTAAQLTKEIDAFLRFKSSNDASKRTGRGVVTWKDLESTTRVAERVLRRFVASKSSGEGTWIEYSGGVASQNWARAVQNELVALFAEEKNNYRLQELAGKLRSRNLFPAASAIPPTFLSDLFSLLIGQPIASSDLESSEFPLGKFDPVDKTILATSAGVARQQTALLDSVSSADSPIPVASFHFKVEEMGIVVAKTDLDRQVNHLGEHGAVVRGLFVPKAYLASLVSSIHSALDQTGYLEYPSVIRDSRAASAFPDPRDFVKRNVLTDAKLVMLSNAVITSAFIDRVAAEVDELLEEQGWVDLIQAIPFLLTEEDEREAKLAPLWRVGKRKRLGNFLVDQRLLDQITDRLKPSVEKLGQAKGMAARGKTTRQSKEDGKIILKQEDVEEEAHKLFPAVPTLLLPEIIEHVLPTLEGLAVFASTSIFTLQETPALALPLVKLLWAQVQGFAKGAASLSDEATRVALMASLADSPVYGQFKEALDAAGKKDDCERLTDALKTGDTKAFEAIAAELTGSAPPDESETQAADKGTEDLLKKQLSEASDPALVVHIAALLLFQRITGKPLLSTGRFVPKILSHLSSLDISDESKKKLLKLVQSQQKSVIKALKDPSSGKPEDLQAASADIKHRLL